MKFTGNFMFKYRIGSPSMRLRCAFGLFRASYVGSAHMFPSPVLFFLLACWLQWSDWEKNKQKYSPKNQPLAGTQKQNCYIKPNSSPAPSRLQSPEAFPLCLSVLEGGHSPFTSVPCWVMLLGRKGSIYLVYIVAILDW